MKVTAFIRETSAKNNITDQAHVYFRVRDGKTDIKAVSELSINPNHWSAERQGYKSRVALVTEAKRTAFDKAVQDLTALISSQYYHGADSRWLKGVIEEFHHPNINMRQGRKGDKYSLAYQCQQYAENHPMEKETARHHMHQVRKILHFERFQREIMRRRGYTMRIDTMTADDLREFQKYLVNETEYYERYPQIYDDIEARYKLRQLTENSINTIFRKMRTVVNWCLKHNITDNDPFATFEMPKVLDSPPFYLTLEERDKVYYADLSGETPSTQVYRDIFMFHCLIGCRVGDLEKMTRANIVDGAVEYIAEKTKNHKPRTIRVPLNDKAKAILDKYSDLETRILPKINQNVYNRQIRKILKLLGINRMVTVIDNMTREPVQKPICDIATSHTARKTFIGNLYKKVKDPNLVASLSGHTDGSRAFARYREIDNEMKRELVKLID
ncbi:MAG: tyrosine-type recombinase/integrase [Prevotella sp.]|nr:tyrosine-type recombinase/integrase [Prevotella sp.]